jgi:inorganic pyrophosphatase
MIDHGEADDKIVGVLQNDPLWGSANDIKDIPAILVERLRHYFATYKLTFGAPDAVSIETIYGCDHAQKVVEAAMEDYLHHFGG